MVKAMQFRTAGKLDMYSSNHGEGIADVPSAMTQGCLGALWWIALVKIAMIEL